MAKPPLPAKSGIFNGPFEKYPEIGELLPAMGYSPQQVKDLEETIAKSDAEVVVIGTPIDLRRIVKIDKPCGSGKKYKHCHGKLS